MQIFAGVAFVAMYVLMTLFMPKRLWIVLGTAVLFLVTGAVPLRAVPGAINWNVLLMIAGTMVLVYYFIKSKMPNQIADWLLDKAPNVMWVIIFMSLFAGVISAFVDNVATVLMVAPVGMAVCRKLDIDPVPMVLSIAVSSNLQGAATLVGDTTSIMLGAYAHMDFTSFFWMEGKPGIFFAVELGALATVPVMMFLFGKYRQTVDASEYCKADDIMPSVFLVGTVVLLIMASFIKDKPDVSNGLICCGMAIIAIFYDYMITSDRSEIKAALKSIDFETLGLLFGLFIVIQGLIETGIIDLIADTIGNVGGDHIFVLYTIVVWASVLFSAFIDNIPYVATMLPVVTNLTGSLGISPNLLYFGLLSGATLGGNLTPVGASANITATGILKKEGHEVSFKEFMKIGVPFTLTAVMVGYIFIWLVWA